MELRKKLKDSKSEIETFDVAVKKATDAIKNYKDFSGSKTLNDKLIKDNKTND